MADLALLERLYHALPKDDPTLWDLRPHIATLLRATVPSESSAKDFTATYRALSQRETGILQLMADGMSNKQIAQSLGVTPETIKTHAKSIFAKLATRTRAQAVARAEAIGELARVRALSRIITSSGTIGVAARTRGFLSLIANGAARYSVDRRPGKVNSLAGW